MTFECTACQFNEGGASRLEGRQPARFHAVLRFNTPDVLYIVGDDEPCR